jgi:uncharacterized protein
MLLKNATTGDIIATEVRRAERMLERLIGFLNRDIISPNEGLWFPECSLVHTLGMRTPIDIVFLDAGDRVLRTLRNVPKNRPLITCARATAVIELGSGALEACDVLAGDRFMLE